MARPVKHTVYESIKKKILQGDIPFGRRISESHLAKELGVSRTPVHVSLTRLVCEGIAKRIPNDGVYLEQPSPTDLIEIQEIRESLEVNAVALAAERATSTDIQHMQQACENARKLIRDILDGSLSNDPESLERIRQRNAAEVEIPFHTAIIRAAKNARLIAIVTNLHTLTQIFYNYPGDNTAQSLCKDLVAHSRILRYIRQGNATKATDAMRKHLSSARELFLSNYTRIHNEHRMNAIWDTHQEIQELCHADSSMNGDNVFDNSN